MEPNYISCFESSYLRFFNYKFHIVLNQDGKKYERFRETFDIPLLGSIFPRNVRNTLPDYSHIPEDVCVFKSVS